MKTIKEVILEVANSRGIPMYSNGTTVEFLEECLSRIDAEQSAEIERLKTVPMKYRRMAFNAQLQDDNARLGERIAELEKEVETLEYEILARTELNGQ